MMQTDGWKSAEHDAPAPTHKPLPLSEQAERQRPQKAPKPPKPRKVERRRRGRKG